MFYRICASFALAIVRCFCSVHVAGKENIPEKGGFILASNHLSFLDPVVLACVCPRKLNFMAKEELFKIPVVSQFIRSVGAFPVKRNSADLSAIKEALKRVKSGEGLLLFPEGRRGQESEVIEAQAGVGFLAAKSNVPVIPVYVSGTEKALPKGAKFLKRSKISVRFGKQISLERRMPYQELAEVIMESIRHLA